MNKLKYFGINLGICYLIILALLFVSSLIFAYTNINDSYLNIFVYSCVALSVFLSSVFLNRKIKQKGALYGAMFGFIVMALVYIIGAMFFTGFSMSSVVIIYIAISVLSGLIGGIIGVNL